MALPSVQTEACRHCGADVREGSAFCYNCGKDLGPETSLNGGSGVVELPGAVVAGAPEAATENEPSAAVEKRRRSKRPEPETVEITWAPPAGPQTLFYVVSIVLVGIAVLLTALALYLR